MNETKSQDSYTAATNNVTELINQIITIRKSMHLTQAEIAKRIGMTQQAYARIENKQHVPRLRTLCKIANALDYDVILCKQA